jgi:hypothetical protein
MTQNLSLQTNWIAGNRIATELYQKARVPTEILQSEAKSSDLGVKIKNKDARVNYP